MNLLKFLSTTALYDIEGAGSGAAVDTGQPAASAPAAPASGESAGAPETSGATPSLDDELDAIWNDAHDSGPARDARGRFQGKDPARAAGDGTPGQELQGERLNASSDDDPDHPGEGGTTDTQKGATDDMPNSWSKDKAEVWKSLTPEAKDYVRQRETEAQQALSRAGRAVNIVKNAEPVLNAVAPYTQYLNEVGKHLGRDPGQLVGELIRLESTLRTAPDNDTRLNVLKDVIAEYGIDISPLIGAEANEALHRGAQADISKHPVVQDLQRRIQQLTSMTLGERHQQMRAQIEEMDGAIHAAASDAQNFPHFEKVRPLMASLIQAMPDDPTIPINEVIKRAYEAACRADPDIFARIQQDQRSRMTEQTRQQQRDRAVRAQRAAAPNVSTTVPSPTKRTLDQDLEQLASKFYRD